MEYSRQRQIIKEKLTNFLTGQHGSFDELALDVLDFQLNYNHFYRKFFNLLGKKRAEITDVSQIPALPVSFLRSRKVTSFENRAETIFFSSGTTDSIKSEHHILDLEWYEMVSCVTFERFYGPLEDFNFLGILPNYIEQKNSSLLHMFKTFIKTAEGNVHGLFNTSNQDFFYHLDKAVNNNKKTVIFGVTYALLDLAEKVKGDFPEGCIVMETGGMKGRRRELVREELHEILTNGLSVKKVNSEYGMTELQSQAYSKYDGRFTAGPLLRVYINELNDELTEEQIGNTGLIHLVDLANFDTIPYLSTMDLGRKFINADFEVIGRMDGSEMRGCNLMYGNY